MRSTDNLYFFALLAITALFALVVVLFVVYFAIKYRDGWMPLELGWSLIPFLISIGIFVWAVIGLFHRPAQNTSPK